jgi:hypothetical protein
MSQIPGPSRRKWWTSELTSLLALAVPTAAGAWSTAVATWWRGDVPSLIGWMIAGVALLATAGLILRVVQARHKDRQTAQSASPQDLLGCIYVTRAMVVAELSSGLGEASPTLFRLTVFRLIGEDLEQCVEYLGGDHDNGTPGRRFNRRSGIIGRAAMTGRVVAAKRTQENHGDFVREMTQTYHIPPEEAKGLRHDRWSWLAVPILSRSGGVIGVVFADSSDPDFFTDDIKGIMIEGVRGMTAFIEMRYNNPSGARP